MVEGRVGKELASTSYAFKTLYHLGGCGGSDCPVEWPNVLHGIQCAVTRKTLKGVGPYVQSEALSLEEAIKSFTINGAYASFEEDTKGSIEVGKAADFVVLSDNPFEVNENEIKDIVVLKTYVNGKRVYTREEN
jgi:predicted amidohydrolase YtcJ